MVTGVSNKYMPAYLLTFVMSIVMTSLWASAETPNCPIDMAAFKEKLECSMSDKLGGCLSAKGVAVAGGVVGTTGVAGYFAQKYYKDRSKDFFAESDRLKKWGDERMSALYDKQYSTYREVAKAEAELKQAVAKAKKLKASSSKKDAILKAQQTGRKTFLNSAEAQANQLEIHALEKKLHGLDIEIRQAREAVAHMNTLPGGDKPESKRAIRSVERQADQLESNYVKDHIRLENLKQYRNELEKKHIQRLAKDYADVADKEILVALNDVAIKETQLAERKAVLKAVTEVTEETTKELAKEAGQQAAKSSAMGSRAARWGVKIAKATGVAILTEVATYAALMSYLEKQYGECNDNVRNHPFVCRDNDYCLPNFAYCPQVGNFLALNEARQCEILRDDPEMLKFYSELAKRADPPQAKLKLNCVQREITAEVSDPKQKYKRIYKFPQPGDTSVTVMREDREIDDIFEFAGKDFSLTRVIINTRSGLGMQPEEPTPLIVRYNTLPGDTSGGAAWRIRDLVYVKKYVPAAQACCDGFSCEGFELPGPSPASGVEFSEQKK